MKKTLIGVIFLPIEANRGHFIDPLSPFFGSIASIFETFTPEQIGVSKSRLWSYGITPERPYKNKICTISKGVIVRKKGNRAKNSP